MIELGKDALGESPLQFAEPHVHLFPGTEEEERVDEPNVEVPCLPDYVADDGRACLVGHRSSWDSESLFIPEKPSDLFDIVYEVAGGDGWDHNKYSWYRIPEDVLDQVM